MSKQDTLRELYYDKSAGLASFDKLWRKVKKAGLDFTQKEVKAFLGRQKAAQAKIARVKAQNAMLRKQMASERRAAQTL